MTSARRGSLIGATWLIGIGIVLLVQRAVDLPWSQAWPMWIILVGVAMLVSTAISGRFELSGIWAFTWPVAWIVVGSILLASTTGAIGQEPGQLVADYWPWALIVLGVWFVIGAVIPAGRPLSETLVLPLAGATSAAVKIQFGAGTLTTRPAAPGNLVDGVFTGGVMHRLIGPGRVELEQDTRYGLPWLNRTSEWNVGLTADVPLELKLDAGANRSILDLGDLQVRRLDLQTGASDTRVRLPKAAGLTEVKVSHGAAALTIEVPAGVAARVRSRMGLGSVRVDEARFPRSSDGYESPDYATAANRVDIDAQGGVGSLRVVGGS